MLSYRTERLVLREAELTDAPFLMELMNQPNWLQYIGDREIYSVRAAEDYVCHKLKSSYEKNGFGLLIVERIDDNKAVGLCGLIKRPDLTHPDIGYALHSDFYNQGFALEAAEAIVADARTLGIGKLLAITLPSNDRSVRLLKKLGMTFERSIYMPGDRELLHLYSCTLND